MGDHRADLADGLYRVGRIGFRWEAGPDVNAGATGNTWLAASKSPRYFRLPEKSSARYFVVDISQSPSYDEMMVSQPIRHGTMDECRSSDD